MPVVALALAALQSKTQERCFVVVIGREVIRNQTDCVQTEGVPPATSLLQIVDYLDQA